jgi:hypothetical protein
MLEQQDKKLDLAIKKRIKAEEDEKLKPPSNFGGGMALRGGKINMNSKLFQETEVKTKMTPLEKFLNTYNYYIKKLLWINVDPYL